MRNSVRLLLGLSMPGLALVALWFWSSRRARQRSSSHSNSCEMSQVSEFVGVDAKSLCTRDTGQKPTGDSCTREQGLVVPQRTKRLDTSDEFDEQVNSSDAESAGSSKNNQIRPRKEQNHLANRHCENDTSRRSSVDGRGSSSASNVTCPQKNGVVSGNGSTHENGLETLSDNQNDKKLHTKKNSTRSRTPSLDEHSDMSSVDGQSPLNRKVTSITDSDIEHREDDFEDEVTWEVEFPQALCGRLIGKKGKNVQKISQTTGTKIRLIPQKENTESSQRLVSLTGSRKQVRSALRALREKFPSAPFTRLNGSTPAETNCLEYLTSSIPSVVLPRNEPCQVLVASIVDASHFYVQLYDQCFYGHLETLNQQMYQCYGNTAGAMVPQTINAGMLCASLSPSGWWWRAQVVGLSMNPGEVEITWLDYGGRSTVHISMLRKLRSDFLQLPCQAVECYLSNVVPNHGDCSFSMAAYTLLRQLTQNVILTARVTSCLRGCPCLELYVPDQWTGQSIFVNREFIRMGFARWSETLGDT